MVLYSSKERYLNVPREDVLLLENGIQAEHSYYETNLVCPNCARVLKTKIKARYEVTSDERSPFDFDIDSWDVAITDGPLGKCNECGKKVAFQWIDDEMLDAMIILLNKNWKPAFSSKASFIKAEGKYIMISPAFVYFDRSIEVRDLEKYVAPQFYNTRWTYANEFGAGIQCKDDIEDPIKELPEIYSDLKIIAEKLPILS